MPKALHLLFDLGKTICYPGMQSALKDPGALRDIGQILAEKGSHFGRLELLRAFLKVYGAYAQEAEATNREWQAVRLARCVLDNMSISSDTAVLDDLAKSIIEVYSARVAAKSRLYEGAGETLRYFREQGYQLAIISDGVYDRSYTERLLQSLGIASLFSRVVLSSEVGWRKPDPRIFAEACQELKVTPGECLFVGDKEKADIIGARNYGMFTIKFQPQGLFLKSSAADFRIRKWSELKQVVESIAVEARI